jgi:hypothetical protein
MIGPASIGLRFGPYTFRVEREQIRALAAVLGLTDRRYYDPGSAQALGLPDLPAPPTLATCFGLWGNPALKAELFALGADLPRLLHGEQSYTYHVPIYAGDVLHGSPIIAAVEPREGRSGHFALVTLNTRLYNQRGELTICDRLVVVVRD